MWRRRSPQPSRSRSEHSDASAYTRAEAARDLEQLGFDVELYPGRAVIGNPAQSLSVTIHYSARATELHDLARSVSKIELEGNLPPC